jgi:hypothetical protein
MGCETHAMQMLRESINAFHPEKFLEAAEPHMQAQTRIASRDFKKKMTCRNVSIRARTNSLPNCISCG